MYEALGNRALAFQSYCDAVDIAKQRAAVEPQSDGAKRNLIASHFDLATFERRGGHAADSWSTLSSAHAPNIVGRGQGEANDFYDLACVVGLMAELVSEADRFSPPQYHATRDGYVQEAVDWLCKAVAAGYNNFEHLQEDPDLAPIRQHEGYKQLVRGLDK